MTTTAAHRYEEWRLRAGEPRPVLISVDLARELDLMDRIIGVDALTGIVHLTEAELLAFGASRVEWNEPDEHGWYMPTLYSTHSDGS
jgi:hypothetical protein